MFMSSCWRKLLTERYKLPYSAIFFKYFSDKNIDETENLSIKLCLNKPLKDIVTSIVLLMLLPHVPLVLRYSVNGNALTHKLKISNASLSLHEFYHEYRSPWR